MQYTKIEVEVPAGATEVWNTCPSYKGYEASNYGRVRSIPMGSIPVSTLGKNRKKDRVLSQRLNPGGYSIVTLYPSQRPTMRMVHALVLDAFVGPRPPGAMIQHIDGDKINNALSNLRYTTSLSPNGQSGGSATATPYIPAEEVWTVCYRGAPRLSAATLAELAVLITEAAPGEIIEVLPPPATEPDDTVSFNFDE